MLGETSVRLRDAIISGNLLIVKRLLRRFPDLLTNIDSENGWSSLHYASYYGRYLICVYLIQLGHDKNEELITFKSNTCVHLALLNGHEQTTHLLLQHFPQFINKKGDKGRTPAHIACITDNFRCLSLLIGVGADLSAKDHKGETPLHICLEYSSIECLKLLLQDGYQNVMLDDQLSDSYGWKPQEVAETFDFAKVYFKLKKDVKPMIISNTPNVLQSANFRKASFPNFRTPVVEPKGSFEDGPSPVLNLHTPGPTTNNIPIGSPLSKLPTISTSRKTSFSTISKTDYTPFTSSRKSSDSNRMSSSSFLREVSTDEESSHTDPNSTVLHNRSGGYESLNDVTHNELSNSISNEIRTVDLEHTITNLTVVTNGSSSVHSISPRKDRTSLPRLEKGKSALSKTFSNDTIQKNKYILSNLSDEKVPHKEKDKNKSKSPQDHHAMRHRMSLLNIPISRVRDKDPSEDS